MKPKPKNPPPPAPPPAPVERITRTMLALIDIDHDLEGIDGRLAKHEEIADIDKEIPRQVENMRMQIAMARGRLKLTVEHIEARLELGTGRPMKRAKR